jgi:hypothetical protein
MNTSVLKADLLAKMDSSMMLLPMKKSVATMLADSHHS